MDADRDESVLVDPDQWARCAHQDTVLLDGGGVALDWHEPADAPIGAPVAAPAGLAFDRWCRAYRSWPEQGRVEALARAATAGPPYRGALRRPTGLAIDDRQRLYVAEHAARSLSVFDLWSQRVLRRVPLAAKPVDVAAGTDGAVVLSHGPALVHVAGRRGPCGEAVPVSPPSRWPLSPTRVAVDGAETLLLWTGADRGVVAHPDGTVVVEVDHASALTVAEGVLVVARGPGRVLRRFHDGREIEPLGARDHDGAAIATAPNGRVAVTTPYGFGWTTGAEVEYPSSGRVTGYRFDAGSYRTRWGRVFLDACLPPGTDVELRFLTTDDDDVPDPVAWTPPNRDVDLPPDPAATPPLPSRSELAALDAPAASWPLVKRPTGREWPWAQIPVGDDFETYEAPVSAAPGRYLWIVVELQGTVRSTPRVRALRVERPGHRLLAVLPRSWSRQESDAAFLQRFLAPAEGLLHELDERAATRSLLLDPRIAPQEVLGWLASFLGLVLDQRWPETFQRALIAEAFSLSRVRGTVAGLERVLELYLGRPSTVMENWRLRGLGGAVLNALPAERSAPAVGAAVGALGHFVVGGQSPGTDGYTVTAHRFTVLVPETLDAERRAVVSALVEAYKPAHTLGEICELGEGLRVGRRAHVGLTTLVGPGIGGPPPVLGDRLLGADLVVGVPVLGARLGRTSRAGEVRVG